MKYNLYIDESGDHGLSNLNPDFPIFLLCGVVISSVEYEKSLSIQSDQKYDLEKRTCYFPFKGYPKVRKRI